MKNNLLIISILILTQVTVFKDVSAQAPVIQWQKNFGGTASDFAYSIIQTTDGGYITAGKTNSVSNDVTINHGGNDCWVVKMNSSGTIDWQRTYGGSGDDEAYSIRQTSDGGYIFAAFSNSNDGDVTVNKGGEDFWIVKLDVDGNIQWQKSYGGSQDDSPFSINLTSDGGYIIGGYTASNDSDVTVNHGIWDAWIVKIDSLGNMQWQKSIGGSGYDYAVVVLQTDDGGYIISGGEQEAVGNHGDITGSHGGCDMWVIKIDSSANIQWNKCYGGTGYDDCNNFIKTNDGGYIICGVCTANNGDVTGNHGGKDEWLVKIDSIGNLQWQKSFGGSADDFGNAIVQTTDGGFATCATTASSNGDITNNHGGNDAWFVSMDSVGNMTSQKCFGGSLNEDAWSMIQTNDDGFIFAGESLSSNGDVSANYGAEDYLIIKLSGINTGIAENNFAEKSLTVFPNPAASGSATASFKLAKNTDVIITLSDMTGKLISQQDEKGIVGKNSLVLNLSNVSAGLYLLNLKNGDESINTKLMVK